MAGNVMVPEAACVPDQPPLARQLLATGLVDQVSTGTRLPVADVELARNVTMPAVCACAAPAATRKTRSSFRRVVFTPSTLTCCWTRSKRTSSYCGRFARETLARLSDTSACLARD